MVGIVVNPVSGGGKSRRLAEEALRLFRDRGVPGRIYESAEAEGIGRQTAAAVADGCDTVVLAGGDGSLSEAVGPLCGGAAELMLLPCGTGNDFARALRLPKDPLAALRVQMDGKPRRVDCGRVNGRVFANVSGSGFDVDVLRRYEELKETMPGERAYRRAVADVLAHYAPFRPEVTIDGKPLGRGAYAVAEVANGQYFGGGMKVAPDAGVDDGLFDVVLVRAVPRLAVPLLLPLFILGWHTRVGLAKTVRARSVVLSCPGMTVNIDGQLAAMDEARYEIVPGGLRMRLPA